MYEVPLSISFLGFGMGTMLPTFHMYGVMLVLRAVFNMLVRNASRRRSMYFRCPRFSLSGPCELLFLLCCIVVSVMLYPRMFCVVLSMDMLFLCCVSDSVCEHGYLVAGPGFWCTSPESRRRCLGREEYEGGCGIVE